jgi:hypothetical protein
VNYLSTRPIMITNRWTRNKRRFGSEGKPIDDGYYWLFAVMSSVVEVLAAKFSMRILPYVNE